MSNTLKILIPVFLLIRMLTPFQSVAKEWQGQWTTKTGKTLPYHIHVKDGQKASTVTFYLTNLKIKRIGTDTDEAILSDLSERGFMVINLDCSAFPGDSPQMEEELTDFNAEMPKLLLSTIGDKTLVNFNNVYYLPEGYNIAYNEPYW